MKRIKQILCATLSVFVMAGCANTSKNSVAATDNITYCIPDTNVTEFYSNNGVISEPSEGDDFYGQDATYQINTPNYTDNGDGTVTDNVTGLMWQQDMGEKMTYNEAVAAAENCNLGGYHDWRVPTIKELYSLIQFTGTSNGEFAGDVQYINTDYFNQPIGNTEHGEREIDAQTWSSTKYTGKTMNNSETVFGVNFIDGRIKGYPMYKGKEENKMYFRLVRGNPDYGKNNFIDNGDGTITDIATGLMWQKTDSGMGMDWKQSLEYAENLEYAGYSDWRLPNAKELQSIVDYSRSPVKTNSAAIDAIFDISQIEDMNGNIQYPYFWSSTTHLDGNNPYSSAVYLSFGYAHGVIDGKLMDVHGAGAQRSDPKTGKKEDYPMAFGPQGDIRMVYNYVRCVRSIDVSSIDITIDENTSVCTEQDFETFNFAVQADIHIDEDTDIDLLKQTFNNVKSVNPSFIMDLGDTLMSGNYGNSEHDLKERAEEVKSYYTVFNEIPICLVNGNHDGENGFKPKLKTQSQNIRNKYFPMPFVNDSSFTGDVTNANYYSFEKENTLFVVLDPFSFTENPDAGWEDTLGIEQYNWLETTLKESEATFKFVFIHNLTGGIGSEHRGGAGASSLYEWGGYSENGNYEFPQERSEFEIPIHDMLVKYGVDAVFHGHDHFYANEERDGINYILVPQPGTNRPEVTTAEEKGYIDGVILPSAGFINVTVTDDNAKIEYLKTNRKSEYTVADTVEINDNEPFYDVCNSDWFYEDVLYVYENDLFNGVTETEFMPNESITRSMLVTLLYRLEGEPESQISEFSDVDDNSYYAKAVSWAAENGIVDGYSNNIFAPDDFITREQAALVIQRYAKLKKKDISTNSDLKFEDWENVSDYAKYAVLWVTENNIMTGDDNQHFKPKYNITRAEAATVFARILKSSL